MDWISELPDELLLRVLSLLAAKDVVATMVLSKRWQFLWTLVPKLEFEFYTSHDVDQDKRRLMFINTFFSSHKAPVLETVRFKIGENARAIVDIGACAANKSCLRELIIESDYSPLSTPTKVLLPRLGFGESLATLRLTNTDLPDASYPISFPSLKKLSLISIKYHNKDLSVYKLLSACPVLQDLDVERCEDDSVTTFLIKVPSLKSLRYKTPWHNKGKDDSLGSVIDSPSLEILNIRDRSSGFCRIENKMPKVVKAYLNVEYSCTKQLLGSIASVQQLGLCLSTSMEAYHEGRIYSRLVGLGLCTCQTEWLKLLMRLLKDSPKLRLVKLDQCHKIKSGHLRPCWSEPSYVPECLKSSLETFEWAGYEGREEEKQLVRFILGNSSRLKTATFYHKSTDPEERLGMLRELSFLPRTSSISELAIKRVIVKS
ncbi:unnamed protein product [Microthlaspi erraticum]|uniref:F-box domain-containing protein n=1 Tax=Microthlaspi erraticum TaxID=1685480 RepID=A0A6D2LCA4_9BRAS|nr:unnamed protein product [Microthlaspi erraticum]